MFDEGRVVAAQQHLRCVAAADDAGVACVQDGRLAGAVYDARVIVLMRHR